MKYSKSFKFIKTKFRNQLIKIRSLFDNIKKVKKVDKSNQIVIFFDILFCRFLYGASPSDYYILGFYNLTKQERSTFVTTRVVQKIYKRYNDANYVKYFNNKELFWC